MNRLERVAITIIMMVFMMIGCAKVEKIEREPEPINQSRFVEVEHTGAWRIVADRETGVMYAVSLGVYNIGTFTLLVDADGKPMIYKGGRNGVR